ncbi:hypothetical protein [Streptomyces sp. NPDC017448]|uniref:hypothetical protein n=1 Tax=Streptomyces sp. NPDC017448 TaxID=3364996 RepID=UPI0037AEF50C
MAPTLKEVENYVRNLGAEYPGRVWAFDLLARDTFKGMKTTFSYAEKKLHELHVAGKLRRVIVGPTGLVTFPDSAERIGTFSRFPSFHGVYGIGVGTVSFERRNTSGSLWPGDSRLTYFLGAEAYDALVAKLLAEQKEIVAEEEAAKKADVSEVQQALSALMPDAPELLAQLSVTLGERSALRPRVSDGEVGILLNLDDSATVVKFLEVIRRGLK